MSSGAQSLTSNPLDITWIIIILIIVSILVTCSEVFLRFGILSAGKGKEGGPAAVSPREL